MWETIYHYKVEEDLEGLGKATILLIKEAVEEKICKDPSTFGKPLRKSLKNLRSLRVGKFRIIFQIKSKTIYILAIGHRQKAYKQIDRRVD
ncbi:type II toxin-antitoxin system RelE/ParE family toxin [Candidatus Nomurabacteria bacterium]|nr:type II toxin-antitoxin system RelE/ParE family toxin [Candidatus Nomurabacteria bacterium]